MICGQDPPFPSATYARLLFCQGLRLLSEAAKKLRRENYSFLFGVRAPPPTPLSFLLPLSSLLLLSTPSSPFSFSSSSLLLLRLAPALSVSSATCATHVVRDVAF